MMQGSKRNDDTGRKDGSDTPAYQNISKLRAAYNAEGGRVRAAAEHFDASHSTVRRWLIDAGIHTPTPRTTRTTAEILEEVNSLDELDTLEGGELR